MNSFDREIRTIGRPTDLPAGGSARSVRLGVSAGALLLLSLGCSGKDFSIGPITDASGDRRVSDTAPAAEAGAADPFAGGSAAVALAQVEFSRAVATTVPAGDNAIALFADVGLALVDLADPANPVLGPEAPTDGKVVAIEYDELHGVAYAADDTGKLHVFSARSVEGFAKLYEAKSVSLANTVVGMARLGSTLYVLTGDSVVPVTFTFTGDVPDGSRFGSPIALGGTASLIAAGGDTLYVALNTAAGGEVQAWSAPTSDSSAELGAYTLPAEARALLAKGSKVLVGVAGVGLLVLDFGNPQAPVQLASDRSMYDMSFARLFGRTLAVGLERKLVATVDLSDFAAPRVLTVDPGALPQYIAIVNGILFRGTGTSATVANVPPTVSISVPPLTASSFPLHGQIPATLSKAIDPASATSVSVTLTCGGTRILGQVVVSLARTALTFLPDELLPAGTRCTLDLSGIKDVQGQGIVGGGTLTVTTAAQPSQAMTIPGSTFDHTPDGQFTDFDVTTGSNAGEWSDVTPAKGMYTYFYGDFKDGNLNILNDWFFNTDKIDPDCYNEFYVWTGGGSEQWTIRAYADRKVTVLKNGAVVDPATSGVSGGAGYGPSPNVKEPHTIYELQIAAQPGTWGVRLHDPGPTYSCSRLSSEPTNIQGTLGVGSTTSGVTIDPTIKPQVPVAPTLLSPTNASFTGTVTPTLAWTGADRVTLSLLQYQVQISKQAAFGSLLWNVATVSASYAIPSGVLGPDKTYFWRVIASNAAGQATSAVFSFSTGKQVITPDAGPDAQPVKEAGVVDTGGVDSNDAPSGIDGSSQRGLTITFAGNGPVVGQGTVTSDPTGISCTNGAGTCSAIFDVGSTVYLTARPASGWHFVSWAGDCGSVTSAQMKVTIIAGQEPFACSVRFDQDVIDGGGAGAGGSGGTGGMAGIDGAVDTGGTGGASVDSGTAVDGGSGVVLFNGTPSALAGDSTYLYIGQSEMGGIRRIPLQASATGSDTEIVPGVTVPANGLAVDGNFVYWLEGDQILRASKNGTIDAAAATNVVSGETGIMLLGTDTAGTNPTHLFWATGTLASATIRTLAISGGDPVTIASNVVLTAPARFWADSRRIYWNGTVGGVSALYRSDLGNVSPIQVGTDTGVTGLALTPSGGLAYLLCSSAECVLKQVNSNGTVTASLAGFPASLNALTAVGDYVYAYNATDVYRTNFSSSTLFVSDEVSDAPYACNSGFFWFNSSGEVRKAQ